VDVHLSDGSVALISDEDAVLVAGKGWHRDQKPGSHTSYAVHATSRGGHPITVLMHRLILAAPVGWQVDHRNGDGLDNRRGNLRLSTSGQNQANADLRSDSVSGVRGVSWESQTQRWRARLRFDGVDVSLGRFETIEEAAEVYAEAANRYFGEFARQNR
jgi:hypothetical protein